jgi:hypothetical protein
MMGRKEKLEERTGRMEKMGKKERTVGVLPL